MNCSHPTRTLLTAVFVAIACAHHIAAAQPPAPLTIDTVVEKLQANLDAYDKSIPSFMADEHMDSIRHEFGNRGASAPNYETIADSVFELKRQIDPATHSQFLDESREMRIIDGRPADGRRINAPAMLYGAFSGGLAVVSSEEQACMHYQLEPPKPRKPIIVRFTSTPAGERPKTCLLAEDGSGRVLIDPASMQITHIEIRVPHHVITPEFDDGQKGAPQITHWEVLVDYRPVVLNNRIFWLPSTVSSTMSSDVTQWSFRASYRNYHLLEVHSRIVLPEETK